MYSETYYKLRKEIKDKRKDDTLSKNNVVLLEQQIRKELQQVCKCGRTENLTLDHIVPIDILKQFGIEPEKEVVEGNYQILCRMCNIFKGNRLDFSNPRTKELLLKILNRL